MGTIKKLLFRMKKVIMDIPGFIYANGFNANVEEVFIGTNNSIYVGGLFATYNGITANRIIRLNTNGTIDTSFNSGTGFTESVQGIYEQADGKLLLVGNFTSYNGVTANGIIRLNTDGTIDNTFNSGTGFNNTVGDIKCQSNGKYIVVGNFTSYNGVTANGIIRLNTDGTIDNTFNSGTGFNGFVFEVGILSDDSIICGGGFITDYNGFNVKNIAKLGINGALLV